MSLDAALRAFLPEDVQVATADPTQHYPLLGSEPQAIAKAIEKRQTEFSAGRDAARRALVAIGQSRVEIPVNARRGPVWPDGVCGSITHSKGICIAVVAPHSAHLSIGIDAERATPLKDTLRKAILHDSEHHVSAQTAIKVFSMKEALFKALFPLDQEWFGFHDAACMREGTLQLTKPVGRFAQGTEFTIPTLMWDGYVISFCTAHSASKGDLT